MKDIVGTAQILKATALTSGDGHKDTRKIGDVVLVVNREFPHGIHAPGQYARLSDVSWSVDEKDWTFEIASPEEVFQAMKAENEAHTREMISSYNRIAALERRLAEIADHVRLASIV